MAIKSGGKVLSARAQAAKVREWSGWSRKEYQKQYDILRNKTRAYERATGAARGSINVADLLAREVRGRYYSKFYGEEYKSTAQFEAIQAAPSTSSGRALSVAATERVQTAAYNSVERQFAGVIGKSKYADDISREVADARDNGTLTPQKYRDIVEKYARALGTEKAEIAKMNKANPDPASRVFFHST